MISYIQTPNSQQKAVKDQGSGFGFGAIYPLLGRSLLTDIAICGSLFHLM
jgi:hypothetical protein